MQENPQDPLVALPILRVRLTAEGPNKRLVIRSCNIDGSVDTVYNRPIVVAREARVLHGFNNFSLKLRWLDPNEPLGIGFLGTEAAIEIEADQPLRLLESSWVAGTEGTVAVHSSAAVYAEALQLHGLDIEAPAFRTEGIINVHHAHLAVHDLELRHPFRATQDIAIEHSAGDFLIGDNAQAQGLLAIQFQSQDTLRQTFKALGSLHLSLAPTVTAPWVLLHHQEAERDLMLESPTPLTVGNTETMTNLTAKKGVLSIQTRGHVVHQDLATEQQHELGFFLAKGRLMGNAGATVQAEADICLGELQKIQQAPRLASIGSTGLIQLHTQGALQWHQLEMEGQGLSVQGTTLDNVSSRVIIDGDASLEIEHSQHRFIIEKQTFLNAPGYLINKSAQLVSLGFRMGERALTGCADFQVLGRLSTMGTMQIMGTMLYAFDYVGIMPTFEDFIPYRFWDFSHELSSHEVMKAKYKEGYAQRIFNRSEPAIPGVFSTGTPLVAASPNLYIGGGVVSAPSITITGIQNGQHGIQHLTRRSPPLRPFKRDVSFIDYAPANSNFYQITPGGDTVYKSVFPARAFRPALDPIIVMNPNGTLSPATPGIPRLFTLEQEEQILVSLLMHERCRGSLRADVHEPEQMLSILKHRAAYQMLEENGNDANGNQALALRRRAPRAVEEPYVYYHEMSFQDEHGAVKIVYVPDIGFPEHFNDPRLRDGAGALIAFDGPLTLQGTGIDTGSSFRSTGHLYARGLLTLENLEHLAAERITSTESYRLTWDTVTRGLLGRKHTSHSETVAVIVPQAGNSWGSDTGIVIRNNKNFQESGLRMQAGLQGVLVDGHTMIETSPVTATIGPNTTTSMPALMGPTRTTGPLITFRPALTSTIESQGPVVIRLHFGHFDTLQINSPFPVQMEAAVLRWHPLLEALAEQERALAEKLKEDRRTAERKRNQAAIKLIISLPVSYYLGGFASSWLEGAMGVTIKATVVDGVTTAAATASLAETALVVGAAGAVSGAAAAAIQDQNILKGALNAAPFAIAGHLVANSSALANSEPMTKTLAQTAAASGLHACLHGRLSLDNLLIAFGAAAVAESVVPSGASDSMGREVLRAATSTTVMALLGNGTIQSLATNLVAASLGASLGRMAAQAGEQQGRVLHQRRVFKQELVQVSEQASEGLKAQGIRVPAKQIKSHLQRHPDLQGRPDEVQARLIRRGAIEEGDSIQTGAVASLARGVAWVLGEALDLLIPVAHASEMERTQAMSRRPFEPPIKEATWNSLLWRSFQGEQSEEIRQFHQRNRDSQPIRYAMHQGNQEGRQFVNNALSLVRKGLSDHIPFPALVNTVLSFIPETDTALARTLIFAGPAGYGVLKGVEKVYRGVELTYRRNVARKAADEAFRGKKYAGEIKGLRRQTPGQLRAGIKSQKENIYEHEQKLRDPKQACENGTWDSMHENWQKNLLRHWKEDIQRAANKVEIARRVLREKETSTQQTWRNALPGVGEVCKPVIGWEVVQQEHNLSDRERPRP